MNNKMNKGVISILLAAILLIVLSVGFAPDKGVSNMDSLHLSDFNGTATPNLLVNQRGSGVIAEFQDAGTPVATWSNGGDFTAGSGDFTISPGNLKVGDGSPTFTQDGEDLYVEGTLEMAEDWVMGARTTFSVVFWLPITPTGLYQPIQSAIHTTTAAVSSIAAPTDDTPGKRVVLHNINASQVITVDGTGANVECKTDIALGAQDTLELLWNGDNWVCLTNYDNS